MNAAHTQPAPEKGTTNLKIYCPNCKLAIPAGRPEYAWGTMGDLDNLVLEVLVKAGCKRCGAAGLTIKGERPRRDGR